VKCSFISDLHLDVELPARCDAFADFLDYESNRCDELYILGDLTEAWIGDDDDSPFAATLHRRLAAASQRCRTFLMHGNRDFLIGTAFAARCGAELLPDPHVIERNGRRVLLCHGDALCTDDVAYQRTRASLRSAQWQRDVLAKPIDERRALAASMRAQSRAMNANKPSQIMDAARDAADRLALAHAADAIVHGHTHRPAIHRMDGGARRYVLGDWDRCGWVLRFDGAFTLLRFPLGYRCEI
jgi:UDP-2,3-diacylglucosamine hydrolase